MKVTEKTILENGCERYILTENFWALNIPVNGKAFWQYFQINKNGKSRTLPSHHSKSIYFIKQAIANFETKE